MCHKIKPFKGKKQHIIDKKSYIFISNFNHYICFILKFKLKKA